MLDSSIAIVAEQLPRDFGQAIAAEYWRKTEHVFSRQGNGKPCGLCLLPDSGQHREPESYGPHPTISSVVEDGHDGYHFTATLSCGHGPVGFATTPQHAPQVGQPYVCWDCQRPIDDRNQPGLPDEVREQIEAQLPKCPECGAGIARIPFAKRTVHTLLTIVDYQTGEINAESAHHDTLDETPDWSTWPTDTQPGVIEVACEQDHRWQTNRLQYRNDYGQHAWTVLP